MASFLSFLLGEKKKTASVAKERLQIILAHERNGRNASEPDYLPALQEATRLAVVGATPHVWLLNWNRAHALNDRVTGFKHCRHTQRFEGVGVTA